MCFHCSSNVLFLSLIFTNLIAEHLGVVLFELILFRTLCFLAMDVCFLYQMREVFSYYFFEYIPSPLISLFLGTPTMWMLVYMIFFQRSLKLFSFLLSFFFFLFGLTFPLLCLPVCWFIPISHLIYSWFLPGYFLFQLLYSSLFDSFIHFLNLLENFNFSLYLLILLTFFEHLYDHCLNSLSGKFLTSTSLQFIFGFIFFLSWIMFLFCFIFSNSLCLFLI